MGEKHQNFTRCPLAFNAYVYSNEIMPIITISSQLDSLNEEVRRNYEERLMTDIHYCFHLKPIGPVYIKASCKAKTLGQFLFNALPNMNYADPSFVVEVDLVSRKYYQQMHFKNENQIDEEKVEESSWSHWNEIHKAANYTPRIEISLVFSADLPFDDQNVVLRWLGESVNMIVFPTSCFTTNSNNYPVLSHQHREVVKLFFSSLQCTVAIKPKSLSENILHYKDFLLFTNRCTKKTSHSSEQDVPRCPLQPLKDDLDFSTYETFEQDKAKYYLYQKAIEAALIDMIPDEEKDTKTLILMVVGAGRGALVRASLNARTNTKRKIKIIIVEKNRNAINTLRGLVNEMWACENIQIIAKDMRKITLDEKADIIISELLGSFGDNELSPECLDGVQHLLKATGISIPCDSVSYLRPVMSKRITSSIMRFPARASFNRDKSRLESNWLCYMLNGFFIDKTKKVFKFEHPNKKVPIDNSRFETLQFISAADCVLSGFSGYFTSKLYKDIEISIHPESHTRGMMSWYSIFFPLPDPIELKKGDSIVLAFSRKLDNDKVWYEFQLVAPVQTKVVNKDGIFHQILLN